ncbi:MAG TPA: DUF2735 domain-containing protein [Xanthobacteraceae bacterium]|nr:DUF2735 domain-containing protein [Xanthobacteraceae bacterium]
MTTNMTAPTTSAKIYTFPPRGRFAPRVDETTANANAPLPSGAKLVSGGGWYHDEAIQAENAREN